VKTQLINEIMVGPSQRWRVELVEVNQAKLPSVHFYKEVVGLNGLWVSTRQSIQVSCDVVPFITNQLHFALEVLANQDWKVNPNNPPNLVEVEQP
jgi:hypothetical protein